MQTHLNFCDDIKMISEIFNKTDKHVWDDLIYNAVYEQL